MKKLFFLVLIIVSSTGLYSQALMLYGGTSHDVFLGYLNTNKFDSDSIWNQFGDYGSKFKTDSIWNQFGTYGSKFSSESPWNQFASSPPVIVDSDGNFYGYMTASRTNAKRTKIDWVLWIIENYEAIKDDTSAGYEAIFQ